MNCDVPGISCGDPQIVYLNTESRNGFATILFFLITKRNKFPENWDYLR